MKNQNQARKNARSKTRYKQSVKTASSNAEKPPKDRTSELQDFLNWCVLNTPKERAAIAIFLLESFIGIMGENLPVLTDANPRPDYSGN